MNEDFMRKAEMAKIGLENGSLILMEKYCDGRAFGAYRECENGFQDVIKKALEMVLGSKNDVVPMSKELKKDPSHVELICKAFMYDKQWYDGTNPYGGRQFVWKRTISDSNGLDVIVYSFWENVGGTKAKEKLFMPTDAEIQAALEEFKKKGWHAQYDRECGYYAVFQGTRALGEHQAMYTRNLF